jgi:glycosyltransferase involved in cell wall biosynthesis
VACYQLSNPCAYPKLRLIVAINILQVMPEFPCPPDNGIRADIWDRLRAMRRLGYRVHALVVKQKTSPDKSYVQQMRDLVENLDFIERRALRQSLITIAPTFASCNCLLAEFPLTQKYDVVLVEGEHVVSIYDNPRLQVDLRVLRVHNDESAYLWELAKTERRILRRQFLRLEALRQLPYSASAYRRSHSLWFISQAEYRSFVTKYPTQASKAAWLPAAVESGEWPKRHAVRSRKVLFVCSLDTELNQEGIRWYLKEVHPNLIPIPGYELVIVGSTQRRPAALAFADHIKRQRRCSIHVDVQHLAPFYEDCAVFVNPMRRGAGVKLKSVHAIAWGIPVVSTSAGNEGSGFSDKYHVRIADSAKDFAAAISELFENCTAAEQMAARAHHYFRNLYDCDANIQRLFTSLIPRHPAESDRAGDGLFRVKLEAKQA